jgi:hypothetical protein
MCDSRIFCGFENSVREQTLLIRSAICTDVHSRLHRSLSCYVHYALHAIIESLRLVIHTPCLFFSHGVTCMDQCMGISWDVQVERYSWSILQDDVGFVRRVCIPMVGKQGVDGRCGPMVIMAILSCCLCLASLCCCCCWFNVGTYSLGKHVHQFFSPFLVNIQAFFMIWSYQIFC